jgi:hypothetical protein
VQTNAHTHGCEQWSPPKAAIRSLFSAGC